MNVAQYANKEMWMSVRKIVPTARRNPEAKKDVKNALE